MPACMSPRAHVHVILRAHRRACAWCLPQIFLFGASPTPQLLISATVCACAVYLYNRAAPPPPPAAQQASPQKLECGGSSAERQSLLRGWLDDGEDEPENLPPLFPLLTRGADGYSIRTRKLGDD